MRVNRWLLAATLVFVGIEVAGVLFGSIMGATAFFAGTFTMGFIGFFFLAYLTTLFTLWANPWVETVKYMEGPSCFNSLYFTWLFENDRRSWAAWTTAFNVLLWSPFFGFLSFIFVGYYYFSEFDAYSGFLYALVYLVFFAICQYQGYWKPRTRDVAPKLPPSVEAEWLDKKL